MSFILSTSTLIVCYLNSTNLEILFAKLSNAAVIGLSEWKFDDSVLSSEIHIDNYNKFRYDWNRHGGGVVCWIRNNLRYDVKSFFPSEIENIFFKLLEPNTKPIVVGIIYQPPSQSGVLGVRYTYSFTTGWMFYKAVKALMQSWLVKNLWAQLILFLHL